MKIPKELDRKYIVKFTAKRAGNTDHTKDESLPENERLIRHYSEEQLREASKTLSFRHIDVNHNLDEVIPGAYTGETRWYEGKVEGWAYIPNPKYISMLRNGEVKGVSIEDFSLGDKMIDDKTVDVRDIYFTGLALVTGEFNPGDPNTMIKPMYEAMKKGLMFEISGIELEPKGEPMGPYSDFADCVAKNQDKENPEGYCGAIKAQVECGVCGARYKEGKWLPKEAKMELNVESTQEPCKDCPKKEELPKEPGKTGDIPVVVDPEKEDLKKTVANATVVLKELKDKLVNAEKEATKKAIEEITEAVDKEMPSEWSKSKMNQPVQDRFDAIKRVLFRKKEEVQ